MKPYKLPEQLQFITKKLFFTNDMNEEINYFKLIKKLLYNINGTINYNYLWKTLKISVLNFSEDEIKKLREYGFILYCENIRPIKLIVDILEILNSAYEDKLNRKELIYFCTNKSINIY